MSAPAYPLQRPLRLAPHRRHGLYRVEQAVLLRAVLYVRFQQQAVHLCARGVFTLLRRQAVAEHQHQGLQSAVLLTGEAAWRLGTGPGDLISVVGCTVDHTEVFDRLKEYIRAGQQGRT